MSLTGFGLIINQHARSIVHIARLMVYSADHAEQYCYP